MGYLKSRKNSWSNRHEITHQIDVGDIIKQVTFNINKDNTVLTINLRCYDMLLENLKVFIYDIKHKSYIIQPYCRVDLNYSTE